MKPFIILIIYFISINSILAQAYKPVKNITDFNRIYQENANNLNSLVCKFTQEKSISLLEKKLVSEGIFKYKAPSILRMEYTKPFEYIFILNIDKVTIISNGQETSLSTSTNKVFKVISQITVDCVSGNILSNKNFKSNVFENEDSYLIELTPNIEDIKSLLNKIKVTVLKQDYTVEKVEMVEISGDYTLLVFKEKVINKPIPDAEIVAN